MCISEFQRKFPGTFCLQFYEYCEFGHRLLLIPCAVFSILHSREVGIFETQSEFLRQSMFFSFEACYVLVYSQIATLEWTKNTNNLILMTWMILFAGLYHLCPKKMLSIIRMSLSANTTCLTKVSTQQITVFQCHEQFAHWVESA